MGNMFKPVNPEHNRTQEVNRERNPNPEPEQDISALDNIKPLNSDDISNLIVEKHKEKIKCSENLNTLQEERYEIEKQLLTLKENIRKGKQILRRLNTEIEISNREYWKAKG